MEIEGGITLGLTLKADRVATTEITSKRPLGASSALEGRPVNEVLRLLPNMFSICGTAQAHAGIEAIEAALDLHPADPQRAARRLLLLAETTGEHCWRSLMDWPPFLGEETGVAALAAIKRPLGQITKALFPDGDWNRPGGGRLVSGAPDLGPLVRNIRDTLLGTAWETGVEAWAEAARTPPARLARHILDQSLAGFGTTCVKPLPRLDRSELNLRIVADEDRAFAAAPRWQGEVFHTGPLARQWKTPIVAGIRERFGVGLLAFVIARLVELEAVLAEMELLISRLAADTGGGDTTGSGSGLGVVEAARGRLVHRVEVADGTVSRYRILAPTEWNFHPEGALVQGLQGAPAEDIETRARLLVAALDPCVTCRVEVAHA